MSYQVHGAARLVLHVVPHSGVPPLRFGMCHADVRDQMGASEGPGVSDRGWYYYESSLLVGFDEAGTVDGLQVSWAPDLFDVEYRGITVFETPASELVGLLARDATPMWDDEDTVNFPDIDLTLWRYIGPSQYEDDDPDDEYRKGRYWHSIELLRPGALAKRMQQHALSRQQLGLPAPEWLDSSRDGV